MQSTESHLAGLNRRQMLHSFKEFTGSLFSSCFGKLVHKNSDLEVFSQVLERNTHVPQPQLRVTRLLRLQSRLRPDGEVLLDSEITSKKKGRKEYARGDESATLFEALRVHRLKAQSPGLSVIVQSSGLLSVLVESVRHDHDRAI